eukprot:gene1423-6269_t
MDEVRKRAEGTRTEDRSTLTIVEELDRIRCAPPNLMREQELVCIEEGAPVFADAGAHAEIAQLSKGQIVTARGEDLIGQTEMVRITAPHTGAVKVGSLSDDLPAETEETLDLPPEEERSGAFDGKRKEETKEEGDDGDEGVRTDTGRSEEVCFTNNNGSQVRIAARGEAVI